VVTFLYLPMGSLSVTPLMIQNHEQRTPYPVSRDIVELDRRWQVKNQVLARKTEPNELTD